MFNVLSFHINFNQTSSSTQCLLREPLASLLTGTFL